MRIVLITDSHLSPLAMPCLENWEAAADAAARLVPDLTIHLGDITLDGVRRPEELPFAAAVLSRWPTPMRCVPGNHDRGDGSGERALDPRALARCAAHFGVGHWMQQHGNWHLFGIDAQLLGSGGVAEGRQWEWLERTASDIEPGGRSILFLHRPLLRPPNDRAAPRGRYVGSSAARRLLDGPLGRTLTHVFSGHTHQALDVLAFGVRHVWVPSCSFVFSDVLQARVGAKVVGVGLLTLADEAQYQLLCLPGLGMHEAVGLRPALRLRAAQGTDVEHFA